MTEPSPKFNVDKTQARRAFSRAAKTYDDVAVLQREIGNRMLQRLDYVMLEPKRILDIGCGTGQVTEALMQRYPKAEIVALDFALPMLEQAKKRGRRLLQPWLKSPKCVCADLDSLPLAPSSFDLVFSNVAIQWSQQPELAIAELHRVLRPEGLVMFSSFGPDTLFELRNAWSQVDGFEHVHGFIDMHNYGDMMVSSGMADPVMDVEHITLTYDKAASLMQELKSIGAANAGQSRSRGLTGRARLKAVTQAYEQYRNKEGLLPATYEVIYGHAWGAMQRKSQGETRVSVDILKQP